MVIVHIIAGLKKLLAKFVTAMIEARQLQTKMLKPLPFIE